MDLLRSLPRLCALALLGSVLATAEEPRESGRDPKAIARWVGELGDEDFETRENATLELWRIGRPALEAVESAAASTDLEVSRRAKMLLPFLRLGVTPELQELPGTDLLAYPGLDSGKKSQILTYVANSTGSESLPFFEAVLETEEDPAAWRHAQEIGERRLDRGVEAFLESRAAAGRLPSPAYGYLGEVWARQARSGKVPAAAIDTARAMLARSERLGDSATYATWFGLLLDLGEADLAEKMLAFAFEAVGGESDPVARTRLANVLLSRQRQEPAVEALGPLLEDPATAQESLRLLVRSGHADRAFTCATEALSKNPDYVLRLAAFHAFLREGEIGRARILGEGIEGEKPGDWAFVLSSSLDAEAAISWRREAFDRKPEWRSLRELVDECLDQGEAEDALALCLEHREAFARETGYDGLALEAAVAALDLDRAREFAGDPARFVDPGARRAFLLFGLVAEDRETIAEAASLVEGESTVPGQEDLVARAYAATGTEYRGLRPALVAERSGSLAKALHALAIACLQADQRFPGDWSAWEWAEARRKAQYLSSPRGVVEAAVARCRRASAHSPEVLAKIFELSGRWDDAFRARGAPEYAQGWNALDAALAAHQSGRNAILVNSLERFLNATVTTHDLQTISRVMSLLAARAARAAGDEARVRELESALESATADRSWVLRRSAAYFTSRGLFEIARPECEAALGVSDLSGVEDRSGRVGVDLDLAWLLAREGELGPASRVLLARFQRRGLWRLGSYRTASFRGITDPRLLSEYESWLADLALLEHDSEAAIRHLRRALAHDPFHPRAAKILAKVARESDPGLAARADRVACVGLRTQAILEPANPEPRYELALRHEAMGRFVEALAAARETLDLSSEDPRIRELVARLER